MSFRSHAHRGTQSFRNLPELIAEDDRGFLYGDALFETIRVEHGVAHFLNLHLARFAQAASELDFDALQVKEAVDVMCGLSLDTDRMCRVTVSRSGEGERLGGTGCVRLRERAIPKISRPSVCSARGFYFPDAYWNEFKSNNYLRNLEAQRFATQASADEALMMTTDGRVGEAAMSNVFLLVDGVLLTPLPQGILRGIVRARVVEIAHALSVKVEERIVMDKDLEQCTELWLTSTGKGISAARSIDGCELSNTMAKAFRPALFSAS